jgi:hypothetical protein
LPKDEDNTSSQHFDIRSHKYYVVNPRNLGVTAFNQKVAVALEIRENTATSVQQSAKMIRSGLFEIDRPQ